MKKMLIIIIALGTLSGINANDLRFDINYGALSTQSTISGISTNGTEHELSLGASNIFNDLLLLGFTIGGNYTDIEGFEVHSDSKFAYSGTARAGLAARNINAYVLGGLRVSGHSENVYGHCFGAGAQWNVFDKISVSAEYRDYSLKSATADIDYKTAGVYINLKIN